MSERRRQILYIAFDLLTAACAWTIFYIFRKIVIEPQKFGYSIPIEFTSEYYKGLLIIPVFWIILYHLTGFYRDIFRRSRLITLGETILISLVGCVFIFFILILDDTIKSYTNYYFSFLILFMIHSILTYLPRLVLDSQTQKRIKSGKLGFKTIFIGNSKSALKAYKELKEINGKSGNIFIGYVPVNHSNGDLLKEELSKLGELDEIDKMIKKEQINEAVVALEDNEHDRLTEILNKLYNHELVIKVLPDMLDYLTGKVKMSSLLGIPLVQISQELMPAWQENLKQIIDFLVSLIVLTAGLPLLVILSIGVKLSSKGPIIYSHERIGRYGKPFKIYKFRSMHNNAEENGPELTSANDKRITKFGSFLRKTKLDELPNFYNVLRGEMSLVGPRPERKYFIEQIARNAPHYVRLHKVKPGITSWGQVKFGYARNTEEMIERMKYDLIYIQNMSLYVDFKILLYTIRTILRGKNV
ncbi:sugar transferase [Bacteroidota bacterium]